MNQQQISTISTRLAAQLFTVAVMIFIMIILGGLTRLTGSGLSMVEWQPITGVFPPLTHQDWQEIFRLYQNTPQYHQVNFGMTLGEFKQIFWLEYIHRVWGRLIGLAFLMPIGFALKHAALRHYVPKLIGLWLLGAVQGFIGWYMVKSGLVKDPQVSPYRLALHLTLALISFGFILWMALNLRFPRQSHPAEEARPWLIALIFLLALTMIYGALVAGMKAGLLYNTFPLMGGKVIPEDAFFLQPLYLNFYQNPATVQWVHRILAIATLASIWLFIRAQLSKENRSLSLTSLQVLGGLSILQVFLGILTLIYQVPLGLAICHQAGAVLLLTVLIVLLQQCCNARQLLSFQEFKQSPSPG